MRARAFAVALALAASGCAEDISAILPDAAGDADVPGWQTFAVTGADLFAVSGSSASDVVMVGAGGTIARWNGKALALEPSPTKADLHGVFVVSPNLAWAVGAGGTVLRWDGTAWTAETAATALTTAYLTSVWADDKSAIAVGQKGAAIGWSAKTNTWSALPLYTVDAATMTMTIDSSDDLYAVTGGSQGILAVGTLGTVAKYDGKAKAFNRSALHGYTKTLAGASTGPGGTYVVGLDGAMYRYDGSYHPVMGLPAVFLRGVAAPGGELYVVGFDATVARVQGSVVTAFDNVPDRFYEGVWAAADDDVWIVGSSGTVLHGPPQPRGFDGGAG